MQNSTLFRRAAALLLTAALALTLVLPGLAAYEMPIQTVNEGESVYLFNADIDKPILEQNADQQRYIASLTKMMTALLFLESGKDMNAEITIPASLTQEFKDIQNANGSTINLRIGDYGNVSSAHDLALIAKACAENETYMQVANTLSYTLPATNLHQNERTITSTNLMLNPEYPYYRDYIRGMKTGFTTLAGRCYVTFAQKDGHTYGLVILGSNSQNIFREAAELFDWAFTSPELHPAPAEPGSGALRCRAGQRLRPCGRQGDLHLRPSGKHLCHRQGWGCPRHGHRLSGRL